MKRLALLLALGCNEAPAIQPAPAKGSATFERVSGEYPLGAVFVVRTPEMTCLLEVGASMHCVPKAAGGAL